MEDLAGIGKIAEVILDKIATVTGTLYEPTKVRRLGRAEADVKAEMILKTTAAELEAEAMRARHKATLDLEANDANQLRDRAGQRLITQEIKRQENLEQIVHDAIDASDNSDPRDIDDDWMEAFIQYAQNISAEGVRQLWSRILANQATDGKPVISKATLDALRLLEPQQARNFQRAIQIFISMGQIMDVDPHGDPEIAFNINAQESLALEDIGFLTRIREKEAGLSFNGFTFSFWNPLMEFGEDEWVRAKKDFKAEWAKERMNERFVPLIKGIAEGRLDTQGMRKETPIDRYILTSRGFELASILFDGFYDLLEAKEIPDRQDLGRYAEPDVRQFVTDHWADHFHQKAAVIVLNRTERSEDGRAIVRPEKLYDMVNSNWVDFADIEAGRD